MSTESHQDNKELPHGIIYFSWGGQQRRVLAIKARRPVLNLGIILHGGLLPLASSEVYECQSPGNSSELPGYLDSSLPARNATNVHIQRLRPLALFSDPPRQRYSARDLPVTEPDTRACASARSSSVC